MVGNYDTTILERTLLRWSIIIVLSITVTIYVTASTNMLHQAVDFSMWFLTAVANWGVRPVLFIVMFTTLLMGVGAVLYLCTRLKRAVFS